MEPARYNFSIYRGATWTRVCTLKDDEGHVMLLSTYGAKLQIHPAYKDTPESSVLALDETNGITLADTEPNLVIAITSEQTAALLPCKAGYHLHLISPDGQTTNVLLTGTVSISD